MSQTETKPRVYKFSEEHRRKIGDAHRGKPKNAPLRLSKATLISRLKATYAGRLQIRDFEYKGVDSNQIITMVCPTHGDFPKNLADAVYSKTGCPKCSRMGLSPQERMREFKEGFPNLRFNSTYTRAQVHLEVTCKSCKLTFKKTPNSLLTYLNRGHDPNLVCVRCKRHKRDEEAYQSKLLEYPSNKAGYLCYRQRVRRETHRWYRKYGQGKLRTRQVHLDHMFSIKDGWDQGVPPEIVGHAVNLRLIDGRTNQSKNSKSCITLKELMRKYRRYIKENK